MIFAVYSSEVHRGEDWSDWVEKDEEPMAIRKPLVIGMGRVGSLIAFLLSELGM
jgi:lactate dehydrogenase-like 2-hydroxyacid dehydrogenase